MGENSQAHPAADEAEHGLAGCLLQLIPLHTCSSAQTGAHKGPLLAHLLFQTQALPPAPSRTVQGQEGQQAGVLLETAPATPKLANTQRGLHFGRCLGI